MSKTKPIKKGLLLETTVQRDRVMGDQKVRTKINKDLEDKRLFTTSFVFREFSNTILKDIGFVHDHAQAMELGADARVTLAALLRAIGMGKGNFSVRSVQRINFVVAEIVESFGKLSFSHRRLLDRLERLAQKWIYDFFQADLLNGQKVKISCLKTLDEPGELDRLIFCNPFPPKPTFPIKAAALLDKHSREVKLAEDAIRQSKRKSKEIPLLKILDRLKSKNGEYDFINKLNPGMRGVWWLGDLLIVIETHPSLAIYTTDGLFDIICPVFGKVRYK